MKHAVPASLKWAYVIVVLAAAIPFGLSRSGWVTMATGGGMMGGVSLLGQLVLLVAAVYRSYMVVKVPGTLESFPADGFALVLRRIGIAGLYVGAAIGFLDVVAGPLMMALLPRISQSAPVFFAAGLALAILGSVGFLGLVLFELSRMVGFEKHWHAQADIPDTVIQR